MSEENAILLEQFIKLFEERSSSIVDMKNEDVQCTMELAVLTLSELLSASMNIVEDDLTLDSAEGMFGVEQIANILDSLIETLSILSERLTTLENNAGRSNKQN